MAHPEFPLCDKYGLIRNYKIECDFVISAKQVEELLTKIEESMHVAGALCDLEAISREVVTS